MDLAEKSAQECILPINELREPELSFAPTVIECCRALRSPFPLER